MKIIKKIITTINHLVYPPKSEIPFFTKDILKGEKFIIGDYTYGHPEILFENDKANLTIGKFCSIAKGCKIFLGGNHRTDWITTYPFNVIEYFFPEGAVIKGHPATKGEVIIGNDVWIGANVTIMSGVSIGDGAVIAAGSVVSKNIGDYEIWGGNPAKLIRKRFTENEIKKLLELKWWNWDNKLIKDNISILCSENIKNLKLK